MGRGTNFQNDIGLRWLGHPNPGPWRLVVPCLGSVFFGALHNRMRVTRNADGVS